MAAHPVPCAVRACLATCLSLLWFATPGWAEEGPIRKLTVDPEAPVVKLFEGIEKGVFEVRVSAREEFQGNVFIRNKTDQPQTVSLPKAAAAVHVLKQFLPPLDGNQNLFGNGLQQGPGQDVGGPFGPANNANGVGFPLNNQFFSIPPEKTVQIGLHTVCLDHGKPAPTTKKKYLLRRLEEYTPNRALRKLLEGYDPRKTDRMALQAAAWHLADGMSFKQLKAKIARRLGGNRDKPYFTSQQLEQAKALVAAAKQNSEKENTAPNSRGGSAN